MIGGCAKIPLQARETPLPAAPTVKLLLLTGTLIELAAPLELENCCKSRCNNDGGPEEVTKMNFPDQHGLNCGDVYLMTWEPWIHVSMPGLQVLILALHVDKNADLYSAPI